MMVVVVETAVVRVAVMIRSAIFKWLWQVSWF